MPTQTSASETNVCLIWIMRWCVSVSVCESVRASLCSWWNVNQVKRAARGRLATLAVSLASERTTHTHTLAQLLWNLRERRVRSLVTIVTFIFRNGVRERTPLSLGTGCWRVARSLYESVCMCRYRYRYRDTAVLQLLRLFICFLRTKIKNLLPFSAVLRFWSAHL